MKIKDYLTVTQAAEYLGVSNQTLYRWEKDGKIKPVRNPMNNYRMYKKEDLEKILKRISQVAKEK